MQERSTDSAIADTDFFFCKDQIIDIGLVLAHVTSPPIFLDDHIIHPF